ncbi:fumarylacetoacetate hydrolase family protein [Paraburkholderia sp. BL17N1]|uniref:fumarylacetoacetate hydrolase family protein n=1 Tax=Paraburkholderia sp. BL17N1 TaxID=1938798 RepID=UPI000EAC3D56|nr:fumarylacetoacetate hydrolase family protein [Paraburkholderia sp. BL17N1]RKR37709.1 2-keto-4-pentenoate hydratase/2-oxohepta-3-ene-1,7-dioic acid hydratase in catechol pathway [Paraburkholderia sp. BL17N1]
MALHVLHYSHYGSAQWGIVANGAITPIPGEFNTTAEFIEANPVERLLVLGGSTIPESEVDWLSPITDNQQFLCQGANYRQHMIESGMDPDVKKFNMIFTKATSCIVPADSSVVKPREVQFLDYEIELGLVLKRGIRARKTVTEENLHEYIAGAVIVNDYSARDIQIPQMQFYKGKSYRTFGPVGPYLCLLEKHDIPKLKELVLTLTVNGTVRQNDTTAGLVYGPAETLSELSGVHDLHTGDLLATGTPSGCALSIPSPEKQRAAAQLPDAEKWRLFLKMQEERPQYLRVGDVVEAHIASYDRSIDLGVQHNVVVEQAA